MTGGVAAGGAAPMPGSFVPPAYPYDRLVPARRQAAALPGGAVDLSVGTPTDPPPAAVLAALADADRDGAVRGYPLSAGSEVLRRAAQAWIRQRFDVELDVDALAVCVGTKEFVATLPQWLHLQQPERDTVLYPAVSYPTYEMGAVLAGLRAVPVPVDDRWRLDLSRVAATDAARALVLWVNTPGNPAGGLDDLSAVAAWGLAREITVASDECYAEFTWDGSPRTILGHGGGSDGLGGVLALHSLSKRSNAAGLRVGWYAGDSSLVGYLREVRKHAGLMASGPAQRAAADALGDTGHVRLQRDRYWSRLIRLQEIFTALGVDAPLPGGGFYLWAPAPNGDAWALTEQLASSAGLLVSPGDFYGAAGAGHVRVAAVAQQEALELVASRLGIAPGRRAVPSAG